MAILSDFDSYSKEFQQWSQRFDQWMADKRRYDRVVKPGLLLAHWVYALGYYLCRPLQWLRKRQYWFITYGDGGKFCPSYLVQDAEHMDLFDKVIGYWPKSLSARFRRKHGQFILREQDINNRHCYIWKPYIIWRTLRRMRDGDILLYMDAGFLLYQDPDIITALQDKQDQLIKSDIGIMAHIHLGNLRLHCKTDVLKFLGDNQFPEQHYNMHESGFIMIRKCPHAMRLMRHWIRLVEEQYYNAFAPTPSVLPHFEGFLGHCYEQAPFSVLAHYYGCLTYNIENPYPIRMTRLAKAQALRTKQMSLSEYNKRHPDWGQHHLELSNSMVRKWLAWRSYWP